MWRIVFNDFYNFESFCCFFTPIALSLPQRFAEGLNNGFGEVLQNGFATGFDFDGGGHAGQDVDVGVGPAAELPAGGAHAGPVVGFFVLLQVFAEGVGADKNQLARQVTVDGGVVGVDLHAAVHADTDEGDV